MRPQFGSYLLSAALSSGETTIVRATSRASCHDLAPETVIEIRLVAPSPSRAIILASVVDTSSSADANASSDPPVSRSPPAAPLARMTEESFVDVSPSTVTMLNERSIAKRKT